MDIWIWDFARHAFATKLTTNDAEDTHPLWSPNGQYVTFMSNRGGRAGIYRRKADGTGELETLGLDLGETAIPSSWSKDEKHLVIELGRRNSDGGDTICVAWLAPGDGNQPEVLLEEDYFIFHPQLSPDGQWMAYSSGEIEGNVIKISPFPYVGREAQPVSTDGVAPRWSQDGSQLYFIGSSSMMVVEVETEPTLTLGNPKPLFKYTYFSIVPGHDYDVHPDGRFLMIKQAGSRLNTINIVLNWFEELKKKVPIR